MSEWTHLDEQGQARMVDVGGKAVTRRRAVASGRVRLRPDVLARLTGDDLPKGDALAAARVAGIMAAKRTAELIPLCHPVALLTVAVTFAAEADALCITAAVEADGKTGVEMEALTAVAVAALTVYDMVKSMDRSAVIECVRLEEKSGGVRGSYRRAESEPER